MPVDTEHGSVHVYTRDDFLCRRDTNTVIVHLEQDEVLALIKDLAEGGYYPGEVWLVIESDKILAKDME